jgi:integrase
MSVRLRKWKDKDGTEMEAWVVDVKLQHPDGRIERVRKASPINTRRGAEQYERDLRQSLLSGAFRKEQAPEVPTLEQFQEKFLTYSTNNNKPSTLKSKKDVLRRHLLPSFGKKKLNQIRPYDLEQFKAAKLQEGLSAKSVNNMLTVLRKALQLAVDFGELQQVPKVEWLKTPEATFDFLTFEEADQLVAAAETQWKPMIVTALNTGMRLGELCGLHWDCVDLKLGRLFVRRSLYRGELGTPKSGRSRELPLNTPALNALKEQRLRVDQGCPWVFPNTDGKALSAYNAPAIAIARNAKRAGLRPVGWHMLRHTFASHLVMRGVPLKAVQELLGHATIDMTMRYSHLSPDVRRDAVKVLERDPAGAHTGHMEG